MCVSSLRSCTAKPDPTLPVLPQRTSHDLAVEMGGPALANVAQQFARPAGMGCDVGQGYLFGRPVPAEDFLATHLLTTRALI
jgi:predicted signal transduction protein with EAL and GGDEF domain